MAETSRRSLIIIGGAEDKNGREDSILAEFVRRAGGRDARIVVMTVATKLPREVGPEYEKIFHKLGADWAKYLHVDKREDAQRAKAIGMIKEATGVFFTGGEQLRITSLIGGTALEDALMERYREGVVIAGTSAGASVMSDTMLIKGDSETNPRLGIVEMSPGLELLHGVVIDQHFAQRGRIGRLLAAIAQHPGHLGLGIDEDTAVIVEGNTFTVMGSSAVTVVDASDMTHSNQIELRSGECLALCDVRLHILPARYGFDLYKRRPIVPGDT